MERPEMDGLSHPSHINDPITNSREENHYVSRWSGRERLIGSQRDKTGGAKSLEAAVP